MSNDMRSYFLKEYGAWSVLIISALTGLGVSRAFSVHVIPVFLALALLVNAKQAYSTWTSQSGGKRAFVLFIMQVLIAAAVFIMVFGKDVFTLLPLLFFPTAYLLMRKTIGEHALLTELVGFVVLSLASIIVKFTLFGGIDVRLAVGVSFYFMAGVFKVKAMLSKTIKGRGISLLYVTSAVLAYRGMHIPLMILLPLLDNIIVAAAPYRVKLQTAGWIEVAKSMIFLILMIGLY